MTGIAPLSVVVNAATDAATISMTQVGPTTDGWLSSADYNIFDGHVANDNDLDQLNELITYTNCNAGT